MSGIEAVRSSTPHACREKIKEALSIVMNGNLDELRVFVEKFRIEFDTLPFESVAFPRGVRGMKKYHDNSLIYKKGTPIQVKGALLFNNLLLRHKLNLVPPISDGDKIKFAYLKIPNPIGDTVIATADYLPTEFNLDKYIDRDLQFDKSLQHLQNFSKNTHNSTKNSTKLYNTPDNCTKLYNFVHKTIQNNTHFTTLYRTLQFFTNL
jgi:hypothetical protein